MMSEIEQNAYQLFGARYLSLFFQHRIGFLFLREQTPCFLEGKNHNK